MHAQLAPFGDVPVSFVARNHPDAMAAMTGSVTQPRTIRMIYAFQSPAAIAALVEKLGSPVVMLIAPDSTPEVGEVFRRCGITAITLEDSKVVTTLRAALGKLIQRSSQHGNPCSRSFPLGWARNGSQPRTW